jgi:hypothetical protein
MTSENTLTGRHGKFYVDGTQIARTTQWSVDSKLANKSEWGDSDSCGFTNRAPGRKDASFSAEGKYDTTDEVFDIFQPEDYAEVFLYMSYTSTCATVADIHWHFPRALCDSFKLTVNIDSEEVIGWTSEWAADGIFYYPGQAET